MLHFLRSFFYIPKWISKSALKHTKFSEFDEDYLDDIARRYKTECSTQPEVSIILTTYNEEANIIRCIDSILNNDSSYAYELVVVNNNSSDNTVAALERIGVRYFSQGIQGSGPSRQMGLEKSKGKYILLGDADCLYSSSWIQSMISTLEKPNTAVVYGRYSFIPNETTSRFKLALYELLRDISMEIRHIKRPFLNAYGISMALMREQGLNEGFIMDTRRGNDGRMCFDLMKYGKVRRNRDYNSAAWTGMRTLLRDGSFFKALKRRFAIHFARFGEYFTKMPDHDTKTSESSASF